jgi:hypothetical protein
MVHSANCQMNFIAHSQVSSQDALKTFSDALKLTPKHALQYTPNCTRWHTPSLLGSTLPSTLSRGKTLPISLVYMLTCIPACLIQRLAELQAPGTGRSEAGGGWQAVYGGRYHDVGRYHSLNLIFSAATATRSHDASRSWC